MLQYTIRTYSQTLVIFVYDYTLKIIGSKH